MHEYKGSHIAEDLTLAFVVSRWNEFSTDMLLKGATEAFVRMGGSTENLTVAFVPGALEIPLLCEHLASQKKFHGIVAIGAIIRGSTAHFDYVASQSASGIAQVSLKFGIPVGNAILTTDTIEQAIERSGSKAGNKGTEVVTAVVETANVLRVLVKNQP